MSGDWRTRTAGLAGCLGEPPHPSVTVTSNAVDYPPAQKFSFPTAADPQGNGEVCVQRVQGKKRWRTYYVPGTVLDALRSL